MFLGKAFTVKLTSDGTFITFPFNPNCPPRGNSLICITGIRGEINLSSGCVYPFNSGGIAGKDKPLPQESGGMFPFFRQSLH